MSKTTRASYAVLIACTISHFMNHVYTGALSPFLTEIQSDLGINYTQIGIISSAAVVSMTIAHLLVGYLGDRGWRDRFISFSILLAALAMLLTSIAHEFVVLTIFQIFLGLGASGYHPSSFPALAEEFPKARSKATGTQAIGGLLGMAITPFLGVTLFVVYGTWQQSLRVLAIIGIIVFIPSYLLMRYSNGKKITQRVGNPIQVQEEDTQELDEFDGPDGWTRNFWVIIIIMGLRGMAFRCTSLLMPLYLSVQYATGLVTAGYLTAVMLSAGLVGEIVSAYYSDKWKRRVPFLIASTGVAAPSLLLLNYHLDVHQLILVLIVIGFFFYLGVPANTAYQTEVSPRGSRGLAFGLIFSIGSIPGALSPIIFGIIGDNYGLEASIIFLVITTALATLIGFFLREPSRERFEKPGIIIFDSTMK